MDDIRFEEFKKMDLRVARILEVEDVTGADRLYLVTVDLGEEKRKMVAGIKPWYPRDQLVGKTVVVIANLEAKEIRGVLSKGMILASKAGDSLGLVTMDREIPPGSPIT